MQAVRHIVDDQLPISCRSRLPGEAFLRSAHKMSRLIQCRRRFAATTADTRRHMSLLNPPQKVKARVCRRWRRRHGQNAVEGVGGGEGVKGAKRAKRATHASQSVAGWRHVSVGRMRGARCDDRIVIRFLISDSTALNWEAGRLGQSDVHASKLGKTSRSRADAAVRLVRRGTRTPRSCTTCSHAAQWTNDPLAPSPETVGRLHVRLIDQALGSYARSPSAKPQSLESCLPADRAVPISYGGVGHDDGDDGADSADGADGQQSRLIQRPK